MSFTANFLLKLRTMGSALATDTIPVLVTMVGALNGSLVILWMFEIQGRRAQCKVAGLETSTNEKIKMIMYHAYHILAILACIKDILAQMYLMNPYDICQLSYTVYQPVSQKDSQFGIDCEIGTLFKAFCHRFCMTHPAHHRLKKRPCHV